ncbi:hypothetical protein BGW39_001719 [Mortierella sp. 14UC]|nr:hypothetical protein BGW39_001719 [Mortierella sp. 14UC]
MSAPPQPAFFDPLLVFGSAVARSVNKLYIAGGLTTENEQTPQFMSLDLTIPWKSTAPAWTKLADGPSQYFFPAAFSADEQTLFAFHIPESNAPLQYDIASNRWNKSKALFQNANNYALGAVTDPRTGLIYIAGGFHDVNWNASATTYMDIFDPVSQTIHPVVMPPPDKALPARLSYGNIWSKYKNSILYWGGEGTNGAGPKPLDPSQTAVVQFATDTMTWDTLDGTKVVIYGGHLWNDSVAGDLWILNVVNSTWTRGLSGPIRVKAACTIAGDQFLLWGGTTEDEHLPSKKMLIYNMTSSKYMTHYTPPAFYKDLKPPPPLTRTTAPWPTDSTTPDDIAESKPVSITAVVGGAVTGLVVLGAVVGIFFLQRRRQRQGLIDEYLEGKIEEEPEEKAELFGQYKGGVVGRGPEGGTKNNPQETNGGDDLEKRLEMLKSRQKEIDETRKLLVQQHQESNPRSVSLQKRAPTAFADDNLPEFISSPSTLIQVSPIPAHEHSLSLLSEDLKDRLPVQAASVRMGMHQGGDSYADDRPRWRESELTQDVIEPLYEPSPAVSSAIPDLVYEPSSTESADSDKQRQKKDPHAVLEHNIAESAGAEK